MNKIFISIGAYDENYLFNTVKSAISNAAHPDNLIFGIFDQRSDNRYTDFSSLDAKIFSIKSSFESPLGQGISRNIASLMHDSYADFYLQIDAHMLFKNNWDIELIDEYNKLLNICDKPIISCYPPYWFDDNGSARIMNNPDIIIDPYNFYGTDEVNTSLSIMDYKKYMLTMPPIQQTKIAISPRHVIPIYNKKVDWNNNYYHEQYLVAGGFLFSSFNFINDIMIDPRIIWAGDEITVSIRALTRGYRSFTTKKTVIWHMTKWDNPLEKTKKIRNDHWIVLENHKNIFYFNNYFFPNWLKSCRRIKDICIGEEIGYWGALSLDELKKYEYNLQIDFADYYYFLKKYLLMINDKISLSIMYDMEK